MTPDQIKNVVQTIVTDLEAVSSLAAGIDPALVPFISIGKAVANELPGLSEAVTAWLEGNPPTATDQQTLLQQLGVLGDPKAP